MRDARISRSRDYEQMLDFSRYRIGYPAFLVIEQFAEIKQIEEHRAAKVFWLLVYSGEIHCELDVDGIEIIKRVEGVEDV